MLLIWYGKSVENFKSQVNIYIKNGGIMSGNHRFATGIIVFILVFGYVSCFVGNKDVKNAQQVQERPVVSDSIFNESFREQYMKPNPIKYFDENNAKYYWVKRWNAPCSDGGAYDGWFLKGTKVDSLVYYMNGEAGKPSEECFYAKHLARDPRATIWWQSFVSDINKDERVKSFYDAVAICAATDDSTRAECREVTKFIIKDIKRLGLFDDLVNPTPEQGRVILLRYTMLYYGEELTWKDAEARLRHLDHRS